MTNSPNSKSGSKREFSDKLRSSIQVTIDHAREERRRELFTKRVELAKSGLASYDKKQLVDATQSFLTYIAIVEEWKKVGPGGLHPRHFDAKAERFELLLISGIYWDLTKIFDLAKTPDKEKDFNRYIEKYVIFSKGTPYEVVCRESLRKYVSMGKMRHKAQFEDAYKRLGGGSCFIATALASEMQPQTLYELRAFRDEVLVKFLLGRVFIRVYYLLSPPIARYLSHEESEAQPSTIKLFLRKVISRAIEKTVTTLTASQFFPAKGIIGVFKVHPK